MSAPRFRAGQRVRVLDLPKEGHVRTPGYVRGKTGRVVAWVGAFLNPEDLAYGRTAGPAVHNYRIEFAQADLWPKYAGEPADRLFIEIYEHWLAAEK